MSLEAITQIGWLSIKVTFLIGLGVYTIFAFVLLRQEGRMARLVEASFEPLVRVLVYIHFFAALALLGAAFFLL
jgi:hypothetical protein